MAEFGLKNNYFQFNGKVKQQISGTAIETKFAPTYACLFMDQVETDFLRAQENVPLVWSRFNDIQFPGLHMIQYSYHNDDKNINYKNYLHRGPCTQRGKMTHGKNLDQSQKHF